MPVTASAIKKLRRDRRKQLTNDRIRRRYKRTVKAMHHHPSPNRLAAASSELDRAAKKRIIHPHKAARLKSRLAKLLSPQLSTAAAANPTSKKSH